MIYKIIPSIKNGKHKLCKLSKELIYQKYITKGISLSQLSKEFKATELAMRSLLQKHEIPIRNNSESKTGSKNHNWKGGETIDRDGYMLVKMPHHPQANKNGYVLRSRLVMERCLGRYLEPGEVVHHRNKDIQDDRIENLRLFEGQSGHATFHWAEGDIIERG